MCDSMAQVCECHDEGFMRSVLEITQIQNLVRNLKNLTPLQSHSGNFDDYSAEELKELVNMKTNEEFTTFVDVRLTGQ